MGIQIRCPHCQHVEEDDLEVLEADSRQTIKCAGCGEHFYLAIMECIRCAADTTFVWRNRPTPVEFDLLACQSCRRSYRDHEGSEATDCLDG